MEYRSFNLLIFNWIFTLVLAVEDLGIEKMRPWLAFEQGNPRGI
jgi:hypothetical protein